MTLYFTEEELKWIQMDMFDWKVKKDCPKNIRKKLQKKIDMLYDGKHYGREDRS